MSFYDKDLPTKQKNKEFEAKGRLSVKDILRDPCIKHQSVPEYGITLEAAKHFDILTELSEEDKEPKYTYYPYYDQSSKLTGFKVRDWNKSKGERGYLFTIGSVKADAKLFGQLQCEKNKAAPRRLVYVEGEGDVVAAWQAIRDKNRGSKYSDYDLHVVGLNTGTPNAIRATAANEKFIKKYENVVLAFDADEVTQEELAAAGKSKLGEMVRGKEAKENVASFLSADNLYEIDWSPFKDAREMYLKGDTDNFKNLLVFSEDRYYPEKIVPMASISVEDLIKPRPEGYKITGFEGLNAILRGLRTGELTVFTAPSNAGKSTVLAEFAYDLAATHNLKVGFIFLEEQKEETALRVLARRCKINYNMFKYDPLKYVTREEFEKAKEWCDKHFTFVDHFGSLSPESLMNKIKYLEHVEGCDFIMFDHLSMIFSGSQEKDERKMIDFVMTQLASYCSNSNAGIIAVSHMNANDIEAKDQDYFYKVTKEKLRGSQSLNQLAWVVLGLEPEIKADRSRGRVRLVVLKNRPWGTLGQADTFKSDDKTGLFKFEEEFEEDDVF